MKYGFLTQFVNSLEVLYHTIFYCKNLDHPCFLKRLRGVLSFMMFVYQILHETNYIIYNVIVYINILCIII